MKLRESAKYYLHAAFQAGRSRRGVPDPDDDLYERQVINES